MSVGDRLNVLLRRAFAEEIAEVGRIARRVDDEEVDLPLLVGLSRKSTIGRVLDGRPAEGRLFGTIGADLYAHHAGASALRVHDVGVHRDALRLWRAIEAADG